MKTAIRIVLAMALMAALSVATVAQTQERGVSATEIVIGTSQPLSGGAAFWGVPVTGGMDAWIRGINDQGGIHGRRIRLVAMDDAYLPPRAVVNVRELVDRVGIFALVGLLGSANAFAVRDFVVENQILWINPLADANMWAGFRGKRTLFVSYVSYVDEGRLLIEYAAKNLGVKTVAVFYQNDLFGQKGLLGAKRGAAAAKIKVVAAIPYELTDREFGAHAVKLRESGADAVLIYANPTAGALVVRGMGQIGYTPKLLSTSALADPAMFALAGNAWNGVTLAAYFPLPGTDAKVDETLATIARINPALARQPFNAVAGVAFLEPFLEGLRRAGPNLTRNSFIMAMESIRNWDGQVARGITFGPDRRQGINKLYIIRSENGRYIRLTPDITYPVAF
ncbi:MAG TPA: ABC transporter substrate-binding protein [bacterium]|jgi:ABC-type branched-subunit amino acid transport system substrate-binding protein|nr:ABC transporter substrate-binding protein [bacterium]